MMRFWQMLGLVACSAIVGCGSGELGPADPSETPQVSEEEIEQTMKESMNRMPPQTRKQYEQYMNKK